MTQSEGQRWIDAARIDLAAAESLRKDGFYHLCAFHAQQAAEKALKGLLRLLGEVPWGHNCFDLLNQADGLLPQGIDAPELFETASRLNKHYIPSRYPDAFPIGIPADYYHEAEADQALEDAYELINFVNRHLS